LCYIFRCKVKHFFSKRQLFAEVLSGKTSFTDFCQMAEAEQTEVPVRRKGRTGTEIKIDVTDFRIT